MQDEPRSHDDLSEIAKFVLSFIQALLKTGYYQSEHPEAHKAKKGLYIDLKKVLRERKEITFVSVTEKDTKDVMIEGIFDEPTRLSRLMLKDMAKMFVPKFIDYFERKYLASFSIKSQISEKEFDGFINIMSESAYQEEKSENLREKMTLELIKNYIISVSTVFNIDLVGKKRKLPWRVELALTRLKNDLSKIPLYKNLSSEKIAEIKAMVFDDIIRPVKSSALIKDILVNLDLISFDTMGMSKEELENEVTEYFHEKCLMDAAPELLKEYLNMKIVETDEQYRQQEDALKHLESVRAITEKVARKVIQFDTVDENLVMEFVKHDLLSIDDLPERSRNRARRVKAVENFLSRPEEYYKAIENVLESELDQRCGMFVDFVPELLSRNYYDEVENIIRSVKKAGFELSRMGESFFNELSVEITTLLGHVPKEDQLRIMEILDSMNENAVSIFTGLVVNKSRMIRKIACEKLIKYGSDAVRHVVSIIDKRKDWYFIRNVLMILAEIGHGGREIEDIFKKYRRHEEQRVREEAVKGITNIMGEKAEEILLDFLEDPSPHVRRKAVWGLGVIKSTRPELTSYLCSVLTGKIKEEDLIFEQVLLTAAQIGPHAEKKQELGKAVIRVLKKKGLMGILTAKIDPGEKLRIKACEALGAFGDRKSIPALKKLEKHKSEALKNAADRAIEEIKSREGG